MVHKNGFFWIFETLRLFYSFLSAKITLVNLWLGRMGNFYIFRTDIGRNRPIGASVSDWLMTDWQTDRQPGTNFNYFYKNLPKDTIWVNFYCWTLLRQLEGLKCWFYGVVWDHQILTIFVYWYPESLKSSNCPPQITAPQAS